MRDPEVTGTYGRAWKRRSPPSNVAQQAALLECWIVDWKPPQIHVGLVGQKRTWYAISVVALRGPRVGLMYPRAEYEIQMVPCRPYTEPDGVGYLAEGDPELIGQFHGDRLGDESAKAIGASVALAAVQGGVPPKREAAGRWDAFIGEIMARFGVMGEIRWA